MCPRGFISGGIVSAGDRPIDAANAATFSTEVPRIFANFSGSTTFQLRQTHACMGLGK